MTALEVHFKDGRPIHEVAGVDRAEVMDGRFSAYDSSGWMIARYELEKIDWIEVKNA